MRNEGSLDRGIRIVLAVVFFYLGSSVFSGALSVVAYILSIAMLVTAVMGVCLLYNVFGINTKNKE